MKTIELTDEVKIKLQGTCNFQWKNDRVGMYLSKSILEKL